MNGVKRKIHFIGVGGIGMSGLAEILLNLGYEVSGSDLKSSEIIERLKSYGLTFYEGHAEEHINNVGIVVRSAAVADDNVEIIAAKKAGIPVIHRSDLLADLIRLKPNAIAVGGTHGKTTTTSMIASFLEHANIGATSIIGGILHRSGTNARWGTGNYLVAEADEHDGSFLRLHPTIAVVTSIDAEHLEYYGTLDRIKKAFIDFCNDVPFYGYSILCGDDPNIQSILSEIESVCITYGLGEQCSLRGVDIKIEVPQRKESLREFLSGIKTQFTVVSQDERLGIDGKLGELVVHTLGIHNVRNALGACAVGLCLGLRFGLIADGLQQFAGVQRRLQFCGEEKGIAVVEDYAHHPTEIASTMEAIQWVEPKRLIVVFQPHLFSRTKFFAEDFARVLSKADMAIITDIYASRESPINGVNSDLIVDSAKGQGANQVFLVRDMYEVPDFLVKQLKSGDVILILGAGNINKIAEPLLKKIRGCVLNG